LYQVSNEKVVLMHYWLSYQNHGPCTETPDYPINSRLPQVSVLYQTTHGIPRPSDLHFVIGHLQKPLPERIIPDPQCLVLKNLPVYLNNLKGESS
jgi:hypothetical protein